MILLQPLMVRSKIDTRVQRGIENSFCAGRNSMEKYRELKLVMRKSAFASSSGCYAVLYCSS